MYRAMQKAAQCSAIRGQFNSMQNMCKTRANMSNSFIINSVERSRIASESVDAAIKHLLLDGAKLHYIHIVKSIMQSTGHSRSTIQKRISLMRQTGDIVKHFVQSPYEWSNNPVPYAHDDGQPIRKKTNAKTFAPHNIAPRICHWLG